MMEFGATEENKVLLKIDTKIYSENVITKVLYWIQKSFIVHWKKNGDYSNIAIIKKKGIFTSEEIINLHAKLSQDFIDFKTREIIQEETKDIRNILLIKAFANNDDFEDHFLKNESPN